MRYRVILCSAILLSILVLGVLLGDVAIPSDAHSLSRSKLARSGSPDPDLELDQAAVRRDEVHDAMESVRAGAVATITYATSIQPGAPMVMGSTDTILEFAPGAWSVVTVTLVTTRPQNPPPGGVIPRTWEITTTASSYEVTATLIYGPRPPDVALVFDRSGSMEFNTLCYGCWEPVDGVPYPGGNLYPLTWDGPANGAPDHCGPTEPYQYNGEGHYFIEAEEYSYTSNAYDRDLCSIGYTYWVLQRQPSSASSRGRDIVDRGAYIMHMPSYDFAFVKFLV